MIAHAVKNRRRIMIVKHDGTSVDVFDGKTSTRKAELWDNDSK